MEALLGGASALMGGGGATFPHGLMLGIVGSLSMMITSWEKSDREKDQYLEKNREYGDTYDFIVGMEMQKLCVVNYNYWILNYVSMS